MLDDEGLELEVRRSAGAATAGLLVLLGEFVVRGGWPWQGVRTPMEDVRYGGVRRHSES